MAFQLPQMPNLNVQQPPPFDPLAQRTKQATLSGMLNENALRSQLAPLQIQEQQQKVQSEQIDTEMKKIQLQGQQGLTKWLQEGDTNEDIPADKFSMNNKIATFVGVDPKDPIMNVVRSMAQHGVPAQVLMVEAQGMLQRRNEYAKGTEEQQKIIKDNYDVWKDATAQLFNADPKDRSILTAQMLPRLQAATHLSPELDSMLNLLRQNPDQGVPIAYNLVAAQEKALGLSKAAAAAKSEEQKVIPPGGGLSPEAQQSVNKDVAVAKATQPLKVQLAREEAQARQQAAQGDPSVAGKMLADGSLTLADLKTRGTTPQFIEQATAAAQKVNPHYNPVDENIAEQVAKSPTNQQFFGSANSLITKGGTLDQLEAQGKKIPGEKLPVLNTVEDWMKLASGKGPLAGYAATALGVADDYGKVMGGGNASDHARDAALQLFAKAASPEQRADAIKATRDAVQSQRDSRIGNNQFLKRQYGVEVSKGGATMIRARDPQGVLHEAPEGTELPKGWKLEK